MKKDEKRGRESEGKGERERAALASARCPVRAFCAGGLGRRL